MIILIIVCFSVVLVLGFVTGMLFEFGQDINLGYINFDNIKLQNFLVWIMEVFITGILHTFGNDNINCRMY